MGSDQVAWAPRSRRDQARNGWIDHIRHADGSVRHLAEVDGPEIANGASVVVTFGDALRVKTAKTYVEPPPPAAGRTDETGTSASTGPNTVAGVVVTAPKDTPQIAELAQRATGKDLNKVYCQTETSLGSHLPRQRCMTLLGWDVQNQIARQVWDEVQMAHGMPSR